MKRLTIEKENNKTEKRRREQVMKTKNNIQKTAFAAVAAFGLIIFGFL